MTVIVYNAIYVMYVSFNAIHWGFSGNTGRCYRSTEENDVLNKRYDIFIRRCRVSGMGLVIVVVVMGVDIVVLLLSSSSCCCCCSN